jgi:hypothetical protein
MIFLYGKPPYAGCLYRWDQEDACTEKLDVDEVQRRLNATECLSAEDAKHQATEHDCMDNNFRASLFAYARALETADETNKDPAI